jgi:hypothetical protein
MKASEITALEMFQRAMCLTKEPRTVAEWNRMREKLKTPDNHLIDQLDSSGFIIKWLAGFEFEPLVDQVYSEAKGKYDETLNKLA